MRHSDHIGKVVILLLLVVVVAQAYVFDESYQLVVWWRIPTIVSKLTGHSVRISAQVTTVPLGYDRRAS